VAKKEQRYQGDVMIERIVKTTKLGAELPRENGLVILAKGEATGHHHSIEAKEARLFAGDAPGVCYLLVEGEQPVMLTHQEHGPIALDPGMYRIEIQREYHPRAVRNVAD
jgi:hypothetical protein